MCRIKAKERTALTALFYDGTVATNFREMTIYDADERFWMLIRPESRVIYDGNSAFNTSGTGAEVSDGFGRCRIEGCPV